MFRVFTAMLFAVAAVPAFAQNEVVVYHNPSNYDSSDGSVSTAACAAQLDPPFTTFGEIPIYPYLAGASFVNSSEGGTAECGTCWQLTSANGSVVVLIVDQADNGSM
ncbi:uncharacterized protein B0H18DRAFT_482750 [Fomitopsis serialis]|uniref:uncharacterized protein n=1 Tax=Fomitopsis serialis TaxID=139415 RepID=UPI00200723C5|nr:uncharacterized protein B0H18DRAFT_482750 [Neoantrodia serialis]KAH9934641.1 hypothetical protein B0H18DRAFT_482750 [Neoantrodia serialis]